MKKPSELVEQSEGDSPHQPKREKRTMTNSIDFKTPEGEFDGEAAERADAEAMATDCGFPDCEGIGHDAGVQPAEWAHRLGHSSFDKYIDVEFHKFCDESPIAVLDMHADGEMTAAELRVEADLYEAYPAWLRARADELDAFNASSEEVN
jgi:hypothetical protein